MVATKQQHTTNDTTDLQHKQIFEAYYKACKMGLVEAARDLEFLEQHEAEKVAFDILIAARCRAKLKKHGIEFPTRQQYQDRLQVQPMGDGWQVDNLTKGTSYTVTAKGARLDCSCDEYGNGFCKHRDAVEEWRDNNHFPSMNKLVKPDDETLFRKVIESAPNNVIEFPQRQYTFPFPAEFTPNDDQKSALQSLGRWYHTSTEPLFRLTGAGGTGKSTIIQSFIKWLQAIPTPPRIAVAAPTNKATKVQRRMMAKWGIKNVLTFTCAQLFGIRPVEDGDTLSFEPDPKATKYYEQCDLVIIDECSMVSEALWEYIIAASQDMAFPTRFVLMGDKAQLPPVNEAESQAFRHPIPSANLDKVERYSGPIHVAADHIRHNLNMETWPRYKTQEEDGTGIYSLDKKQWQASMLQAFTSDKYRQNPDYAKVLAYRNNRVALLNTMIRNALGYTAPWVEGERIVALSPYFAGTECVLSTSDEATVLQVREGSVSGWECFYLFLDNGQMVPVPRNPAAVAQKLKEYSGKRQWSKYWGLKRNFASVGYGYAMTVHRSQGSTYDWVFVDIPDLARCRGQCRNDDGMLVREKNQLLYVAFSRTSQGLVVYQ